MWDEVDEAAKWQSRKEDIEALSELVLRVGSVWKSITAMQQLAKEALQEDELLSAFPEVTTRIDEVWVWAAKPVARILSDLAELNNLDPDQYAVSSIQKVLKHLGRHQEGTCGLDLDEFQKLVDHAFEGSRSSPKVTAA